MNAHHAHFSPKPGHIALSPRWVGGLVGFDGRNGGGSASSISALNYLKWPAGGLESLKTDCGVCRDFYTCVKLGKSRYKQGCKPLSGGNCV